jgi:mono/diheme cytochrome c family protein
MSSRRRGLLLLCLLVAVGTGAVIGLALALGGGSSSPGGTVTPDVPRWVQQERLPRAAVRGATLFATAGCTACHTYAGSGRTRLEAPDLTAIGSRRPGIGFLVRFLRCPSCVDPGSPMPRFDSLGGERLHQLAVFLEDSKGIR